MDVQIIQNANILKLLILKYYDIKPFSKTIVKIQKKLNLKIYLRIKD